MGQPGRRFSATSVRSSTLLYGGDNPGKVKTLRRVWRGIRAGCEECGKRLSMRGEGRDFWSGEPDFHWLRRGSPPAPLFCGGGAFWRFSKIVRFAGFVASSGPRGGFDFFIQFCQALYILDGISKARGLVDVGKARDRFAEPAVFDLFHELLGGLGRRFFHAAAGQRCGTSAIPHGRGLFRRPLGMRAQPLFVQAAHDAPDISQKQEDEARSRCQDGPAARESVRPDPDCGAPTAACES